MIYKFYKGDPNMIYNFIEDYKTDRYQVIEKEFKNRTEAEIFFINRENEFNKIAFDVAGQKMLVCCIEVLKNFKIINALKYRVPGHGIIWVDLLL